MDFLERVTDDGRHLENGGAAPGLGGLETVVDLTLVDWTAVVNALRPKRESLKLRSTDHEFRRDNRNVISFLDETFESPGIPVDALGHNPDNAEIVHLETMLLNSWNNEFGTLPPLVQPHSSANVIAVYVADQLR